MAEREYIGGDVMIWRENGQEVATVERIANNPNGWIALTVCTNATTKTKLEGIGSQWLTPETAREIAKTLLAYAETIEQDKGYCHDPFAG